MCQKIRKEGQPKFAKSIAKSIKTKNRKNSAISAVSGVQINFLLLIQLCSQPSDKSPLKLVDKMTILSIKIFLVL